MREVSEQSSLDVQKCVLVCIKVIFFEYDTRLIASVFVRVYCLASLCWFLSQFVMAIKLQTASDLDSLPPQS